MSFVYVLMYLYPKIKLNVKTCLCQSRLKLKSVLFFYCDFELNELGNGGN